MIWFLKKKETQREEVPDEQPGVGFFEKIKKGLSRSSSKISQGITDIFTKKKLDATTLQQLEELLIMSDIGPVTSARLAAAVAKTRFDNDVEADDIKQALAVEIENILQAAEKDIFGQDAHPFVILMAGVNGTGKTTTIGKLASQFKSEGKKVLLAAGDTFRAAAVEQLKVWGERVGCDVIAKEEGADAAALAYEACERALADQVDILMIDTAGRLQNQDNLMAELEKVVRVIKKKIPDAPHATLLVLDATVGQNAYAQVELFKQKVNITGLIVTKLDGTAKGGVVVGLVERFGLPVHAIGIGEGVGDLRPFSASEFASSLIGLDHIVSRT